MKGQEVDSNRAEGVSARSGRGLKLKYKRIIEIILYFNGGSLNDRRGQGLMPALLKVTPDSARGGKLNNSALLIELKTLSQPIKLL